MVADQNEEIRMAEKAAAAACAPDGLSEEDRLLLDKYSRTFIG